MNKRGFIKELEKKLNMDEETCIKINNIVEDIFLIGKDNKQKMVQRFIEELDVSKEEANNIYSVVCETVSNGIKERLKHPFKNLDK